MSHAKIQCIIFVGNKNHSLSFSWRCVHFNFTKYFYIKGWWYFPNHTFDGTLTMYIIHYDYQSAFPEIKNIIIPCIVIEMNEC